MEMVWYSPERDDIAIATKESGFLFKNEDGEFHLRYLLNDYIHAFKTYKYFLVGEL